MLRSHQIAFIDFCLLLLIQKREFQFTSSIVVPRMFGDWYTILDAQTLLTC